MRASRVAALLLILCYAIGGTRGAECPEDSVREESGECKCAAIDCPSVECQGGQRPIQVKPADPETPGSCCARYECVPADPRGSSEPCPENSVLTEDGKCECAPCPPVNCQPGHRSVQVTAALDRETPGSCCPLYECRPAESVSWVKVTTEMDKSTDVCVHEGQARKLGERWQQSDCEHCVCQENRVVSCQGPMCKSCDNAIPPHPGECCPHCPPLTNKTHHESELSCPNSLEGCELVCQRGYATDENNCPLCECDVSEDDETATTEHSTIGVGSSNDKICPELAARCESNCEIARDENGCPVCACRTMEQSTTTLDTLSVDDPSGKKICPELKCDLHCERGLVMDENDCTFCKCREEPESSSCPPLLGCRKRCAFGYKTNRRGCPMCRCRASCTDHLNGTHPEGSTWHPNSCTSCTCEAGGKLSCKETVCSVACNDPLPPQPGTCCPVCPITPKGNGATTGHHSGGKGWGTVPITLIAILALLCLLLIVHIVRGRFRARLSPSETSYSTYPPQYYKCVPAYDTPVHRNEKIVPL